MWLQFSSKLNTQFEMDIPLPRQVCAIGIKCSLRRYVHVDDKHKEMIQYVLAVNSSPLQHESSRIVDIDFIQPK